MHPSDDSPTRYANRMRRLVHIVAKGLQLEFVHNRRTARLWEEALRELLAVVDEWRLRWPEWMEEPDYVVWQAVRYLVEHALADIQAIVDKHDNREHERSYDRSIVEAAYSAADRLRDVIDLLSTWKHKRGEVMTSVDWRGDLGWFLNARKKLEKEIRRFQIAIGVPAATDPGDDPLMIALQPYFMLCEVSRRVFQLLYLVLVVSPWELKRDTKEEIDRLCRTAHGLMPEGRLKLAIEWRIDEIKKLLTLGQASAGQNLTPMFVTTDSNKSLDAYSAAYDTAPARPLATV